MMKRFFLYVFLILTISCSKEDSGEYATDNTQKGIIGRWKLIESRNDDGGGNIHVQDKRGENRIISFDTNGIMTDVRIKCEGEYTFVQNKGEYLTAIFKCLPNANQLKWGAQIKDNNYLHIHLPECLEPCTDVYRRLKD